MIAIDTLQSLVAQEATPRQVEDVKERPPTNALDFRGVPAGVKVLSRLHAARVVPERLADRGWAS